MKLCKVADVADWQNPEFQATAALLKLNGKNRKAWEFIHVYTGLKQLGCLHEDARALGLGVGREPLVYALTNSCKEVVATDLYNSDTWSTASMSPTEVYNKNRFSYHPERLVVRHMDMTQIDFPDNSFDFIWSCCAIEHVNNFRDLHKVYQEIHRVLKPGGIAALTTETNKTDRPLYEPNLLYTDQLWVDHWLLGDDPLIQGFDLLDPPDFYLTDSYENRPIPRREPLKLIQVYTKDIISSSIAFFLRKAGEFSKAYDESWLPAFWSGYLAGCDRITEGKFFEAEQIFKQLLQDPTLEPRLKVRAARRLLVTLEAQHERDQMIGICKDIFADCQITDDQDQIMPIANFCQSLELWTEAKVLYERVENLQGSTINQVIDSVVGQSRYYQHLGQHDKALILLESVQEATLTGGTRTEKSVYPVFWNMGICCERLGNFDAAVKHYQIAVNAADPRSKEHLQASLKLRSCQLEQRLPVRSTWKKLKQRLKG
ncbi:methyltransferase domain-containing protein [Oscillatoria sp. FACHB-1407]|uniref:methyltransferase domain-containing protein n=1 Tax=Oscillatoria sp. FACHB-1407 TaxID=2692847 RepID=UPI001683CC78|nr:methyltransferase domain-containing protein [Oscillatoria sp. FACHB-1407]MBD2460496.1 methyltransferase domain-containing protein [Oscillatoria sp. FACHB-1407]